MVIATFILDTEGNRIPNPELSEVEFQGRLDEMKAANIDALWNAGHAWEFQDINGAGIGMLVLGVTQNKPKALAVMAWIQTLWALYYQRKPLVTHDLDPQLLDFSSVGRCPHTIPELLTELGM